MILKNVENKENKTATFQVESDAAEFESAVNGAYLKNKASINIPGFRKGKAPRAVVEGMYGAEVFYQDAMDELAPKAFEFGLDESKLRMVGTPSIVDVNVTDDRTASYTFEVTLYPEVTLGQYKGLEAERKDESVSDEDVDNELNSVRKRNARMIDIDDRAAELGDTVDIDFDGYLDGERFDGGKAEGYSLELGSNSFVPGFEDQVVGMKIGEEKDIDITFPENYTPELAGKPVVFHVKVNEVKVKEIPAMDDEFAKDVSEFDTLKELKADLKKKITGERKESAQRAFEDVLMQKVAEGITCDIPDAMVNLQAEQMANNFKQQLASQGIPFDQYLKMTGTTEADFLSQAHGPAQEQVRMDLAVEAIIKAEGLEATDDEVNAEMQKLADKYGMDLESVKKYLPAAQVREQVIREKVVKLVADSAVAVAPEAEEKKEDKAEETAE